jgi:hypothetical protein
MVNKFEQLIIIRDEILTNPAVDASLVWDATKLAEEDKYLNDLLVDWAKSTNELSKSFYLDEILNYTEQKLKVLNEKSNQ